MGDGRGVARGAWAIGAGVALSLVVACGASDGDWEAAREEFAAEGPAILKAAEALFAASGEMPGELEGLGLDEKAITSSKGDFVYHYRARSPMTDGVTCEAEVTLVENRVDGDLEDPEATALMTSLCDATVAAADRSTAAELTLDAEADVAVIVEALADHFARSGRYPTTLSELGLPQSDLSAQADGVPYNLRVYPSEEPGSYAYRAFRPGGGEPCLYSLSALWVHGDFREIRREVDHCPAQP